MTTVKKRNRGKSQKKSADMESAVRERYAAGAREREEALCCPVEYDDRYLKAIPKEILERDYGCGDPSKFLRPGETVLDLGSGGGKICYIASQVVGPKGRVIGVDFNPDMLALARKHQAEAAKKIGWSNVEFRRGKIQDLKTDLDRLESAIKDRPIRTWEDMEAFEIKKEKANRDKPLVADESVDVIVSNCVLNLVRSEDKKKLFAEMHRVLKRGGRAAISDIVSDEAVPEELQKNEELWSGCISGAFEEKAFVRAFEESGFYGIKIEKRDEKPWRTVAGIEFRSVTITAYKGKEGECWERNQAVIYKGPWKQVMDDDRHTYRRGARTAVCDKTFNLLMKEPYKNEFEPVLPIKNIPLSKAKAFDCKRNAERDPRETKGKKYKATTPEASVCMEGSCC